MPKKSQINKYSDACCDQLLTSIGDSSLRKQIRGGHCPNAFCYHDCPSEKFTNSEDLTVELMFVSENVDE
jgi:hypothetical protein